MRIVLKDPLTNDYRLTDAGGGAWSICFPDSKIYCPLLYAAFLLY